MCKVKIRPQYAHKTSRVLFGVVQSCLLLFFLPSILPGGERGSTEVKSITKVSEKISQVDLAGKNMRVRTGATNLVVEAALTLTEYRCRVQEGAGDKTEERERTLFCYELSAKGEEVTYARAIWTRGPVQGFRLSSDRRGENYLAWVDGRSVFIEDVTEPRGLSDALNSYLSKTDRYRVPVMQLTGETPFLGLNALHMDADIVSVGENETGRLHLVVMATKTGEQFEFVFNGKAWERLAK